MQEGADTDSKMGRWACDGPASKPAWREAVMDARALMQEAAKRRSTVVNTEFGPAPSSIGYLEGLLQQASSTEEKHLLFALILGECTRAENRLAEVHFLRRQLTE